MLFCAATVVGRRSDSEPTMIRVVAAATDRLDAFAATRPDVEPGQWLLIELAGMPGQVHGRLRAVTPATGGTLRVEIDLCLAASGGQVRDAYAHWLDRARRPHDLKLGGQRLDTRKLKRLTSLVR